MNWIDSWLVYTGLVAAVASLRLFELAVSRRNIARLRARGAVEFGEALYPWMVAVHSGFLLSCPTEVWLLDRPFHSPLGYSMLAVLCLAAAIRWWAISTLGERWSTRVVFVPGEAPVTGGPYRWLRHPNYLAVILEFMALPLIHTAWLTAVVFSLANAFVLVLRIRTEEASLSERSEYSRAMGDRPRFHPGLR